MLCIDGASAATRTSPAMTSGEGQPAAAAFLGNGRVDLLHFPQFFISPRASRAISPLGSQGQVLAGLSGPGISEAAAGTGPVAASLPHAFERFRRPDQGRARSAGGAGALG